MSDAPSSPRLDAWVRTRMPVAPTHLATRIDAMITGHRTAAASPEALLAAAESAMRSVLREGCLTRASALDLLAVDALVTYAFEAAADDPDALEAHAETALTRIASLSAPFSS